METKELLEIYKSVFDTWRFEVNSHWQRSSYFAAFETVALGACWKLLDGPVSQQWAGVVLSMLGAALTGIWFLNNQKTHYYSVFWLRAVRDVEARLIEVSGEQIGFATKILERRKEGWIRHRHLVQTVPVIFYFVWVILILFGAPPAMVQSGTMRLAISRELVSLIVGLASLAISLVAVLIAKSSLSQAEQVAARDHREWKQRKWFDIYSKADEAYDALDRFQVLYPSTSAPGWKTTLEWEREFHDLMRAMRTVNRIAIVFPKNPEAQALFEATAAFENEDEAVSKDRLDKLFEAVEGLRQKAKVDPSVLE